MLVWWAAETECVSAISRLARDAELNADDVDKALTTLDDLQSVWSEVEPGSPVRSYARRLLRVHELRAADALQLAAAVLGAEHHPALLPLVTLDRRLARAARQEGFPVLMPGDG